MRRKRMKNNIAVRHASKKYTNFTLKDISFEVPCGTIVGLIGENGAGKTTLIKSILNIIHLDQGKIELLGEKNQAVLQGREEIGVVLDGSFFAETLKVKDINLIMQNLYKNWDAMLFFQYLQDFQIPVTQTIKTLSKGMRKKVEIFTALAHHPKVLILDEPTSGLDPVVRTEILDLFLEFIQEEDHSILLSTHITSDLEHIADYIVFVDQGELIFSKTRDELLENYGILRCDQEFFDQLEATEIIRFKKNRYNYDVLVSEKRKLKKKYPTAVIDAATIEDIMVLYIKGGRK